MFTRLFILAFTVAVLIISFLCLGLISAGRFPV